MTAPTPRRPPKQEQEEASSEVTEVAPGILRIQLPIAFTGLGHVNCYVLEDSRGLTLVDPGMPGRDTFRSLEAGLGQAGLSLPHVHTVLVTHSHPDHFGGAGLVARRAEAEVVASTTFRTWLDVTEQDLEDDPGAATPPHDDGEAFPATPRQAGTPFGQPTPWGGTTYQPPLRHRLRFAVRHAVGSRWFAAPHVSRRLADTETIELGGREWQGLHTPGHTEDHLCLFDADGGVLLSGDHVLPTITPHLSGMIPGDPLTDFLASLERVAELHGVTTVLPAHGHPFTDLPGRVDDISRHHEERLGTLRGLVAGAGPTSVQELSLGLFGRHGTDSLAQSETYAHLEHLRIQGGARRRRDGDHLVYWLTDPATT